VAEQAILQAHDLIRRADPIDDVFFIHGPNVALAGEYCHNPSRLSPGANHCILAGMSWHRTPTDNAWKQARQAMVEGLGKRLWLGCEGCEHTVMIAPRELADRHGLDKHTPLQTLSRALRCTRCGEGRGKPA
jgi:hypothetical protein